MYMSVPHQPLPVVAIPSDTAISFRQKGLENVGPISPANLIRHYYMWWWLAGQGGNRVEPAESASSLVTESPAQWTRGRA